MFFGKLDIDEISKKIPVNGLTVPTLLAIRNGDIVDELVGLHSMDEVISFINKPRD